MNTREYTKQTGTIKKYDIIDEMNVLKTLDNNKPSKRMILTKKGLKSIYVLRELEKNHNHSFYKELKQRTENCKDANALFYRGRKISFKEMFEHADAIAASFAKCGIKKGDEIPCCLANTPELVYILLAANKIGAKVNLFGSHFNKEYLSKILNKCTNKVIISSDDNYGDIKEVVNQKNFDNKVVISLADSLLDNPELSDEYEPELDKYYHFENKAKQYKAEDNTIQLFSEFENSGKDYDKKIIDDNTLDTEFLVTYTSGSTKIGLPSGLRHSNRSVIVSGRFHDADLTGTPDFKDFRGMAHIHSESNTNIITCITDNLLRSWCVAMEPEYSEDKVLDYVFLNKPTVTSITKSFLIKMAKQYLIEKKFHKDGVGRKMDFFFSPFCVGEEMSKGEEKLINKFLRVARAGSGIKINGFSLPFVQISVGGADCEHGGIFYTLWRTLYEKINVLKLNGKPLGLMPISNVQVSCFKKLSNGLYEECDYNQYGIIAANSPTNMIGYKDDLKKTYDKIITDTNGRDWLSLNVYGYIDNVGGVHMKGRMENVITFSSGDVFLAFVIEDEICKDTKNILSCSVTQSKETGTIVVNVQFQPNKKKSDEDIILSIRQRCLNLIKYNNCLELCYRIFDINASFPLGTSGKRSISALEQMDDKDLLRINNCNIEKVVSQEENFEKKLAKKNYM